MTQNPIIRFTTELMRLTDDLDQAAAAAFVQRVYAAGREDGAAEAAKGASGPE
ncbi:hypothetical protein ACFWVC_23600 [Streptomyces sp. NPDC058691]|uniref:hypothetical protein n=1 Tax=Streptomyces sp. NPDC058691 TaxID=3346601 RepID=UPI003669BEB8